MTIEVNGDRIVLKGRCGVEEAEPLLAALAERPDRLVVSEAERLHTALCADIDCAEAEARGDIGGRICRAAHPAAGARHEDAPRRAKRLPLSIEAKTEHMK